MANLSITAASFIPSTSAVYQDFTAGAALTRGQPYYLDSADSYKAKLADADTQAEARAVGMASVDVATGQRGKGIVYDPALQVGATLVAGNAYVVSTTAGAACPVSDLGTGDYTTYLLFATSTTTAIFQPVVTDVVRV